MHDLRSKLQNTYDTYRKKDPGVNAIKPYTVQINESYSQLASPLAVQHTSIKSSFLLTQNIIIMYPFKAFRTD